MKTFKGFSKGVNLGGWISQFDRYDESHFNSFITKADIDLIAGPEEVADQYHEMLKKALE